MSKSILLGFFLLIGNLLNAQFTPTNQKRIGGNSDDQLKRFYNPNDLSYSYLIGSSMSGISGDKTVGNYGGHDIWIVKLDANGNKVWDKNIGGSGEDYFSSALITDQAIFIGVGSLSNLGGNKTIASNGGFDIWMIKMDHQGAIVQQNSYGGDQMEGVSEMSLVGNQLVLLGNSSSGASGNKTSGTYGGYDAWLLQIDTSDLSIDSQKAWGSPLDDSGVRMEKIGANYFITCSSGTGTGNDKTENGYGLSDVWLLKTDLNFNLLENKCFGGSEDEYVIDMCQLNGELIITTTSQSNTGGSKTQDNFGSIDTSPKTDCWVLKVDPVTMNQVWDLAFGGTNDELYPNISVLDNNRMIISVWTRSSQNTGNISSQNFGLFDTKYLTIDLNGNMLTQFSMGGSGQDYCHVSLVNNGIVYFSGYSDSNISGNKTVGTVGGFDAWYSQASLGLLGISELDGDPLLSVYPNPFTTEFVIKTESELGEIHLIDLCGQELPVKAQKVASGYSIDAENLKEGVYFVQTNLGVVQLIKHGK